MGVEHGCDCVGSSWALMAALFALGAMSLTWMEVVAVLVAAERLLPRARLLVALVFRRSARALRSRRGTCPG